MSKINTFQLPTSAFVIHPNNKQMIVMSDDDIAVNLYKELGLVITNPFIDTLVMGYDLQGISFAFQQDQIELVNTLAQALIGFAKETIPEGKTANSYYLKTDAHKQSISKKQGYGISVVYVHPQSGQDVHIQMRSPSQFIHTINSKNRKPLFKITMNPSQLMHAGLRDFFSWLDVVTYEIGVVQHILTTPKIVKEIHIAVDILGASVEQMQLNYMGTSKNPIKKILYLGADQTVESVYAAGINQNGKRLKKGGIYVYDKKACQKAKGKEPVYGEVLHTRLEQRTSFSKRLIDLPQMNNRLGSYALNCLNMRRFHKQCDQQKLYSRLLLKLNKTEVDSMLKKANKEKLSIVHEAMLVTLINDKTKHDIWKRFSHKNASNGVMRFFTNPF